MDIVVFKLGLGQRGCECQAAAKYDPAYKKSDPKRAKKPEKYASVSEASGSGRESRNVSRGQKNEVRHLQICWSSFSNGYAGERIDICDV